MRVEIPPRVASEHSAIALCMEPHDLVLAKCVAGRDRDWEFAGEALRNRLVDPVVLLARVDDLPVRDEHRASVGERLRALARSV